MKKIKIITLIAMVLLAVSCKKEKEADRKSTPSQIGRAHV